MKQDVKTPPGNAPAVTSKWLTEYEVINRFKICKKTLNLWHFKSKLPRHEIGRFILYKESDLDEFIERHRKVIVKVNRTIRNSSHA